MKSLFRRGRAFPISLKLACLGLSLIIAGEVSTGISKIVAAPQLLPSASSKKPPVQVIEPPFDAWISAINEHPLFAPGREGQNADTAAAPVAEAPPEIPGRLAGMMINLGVREALFAKDGERPVAVKEGEEIDGWTVRSIGADHVVLKNKYGEQTVEPTKGTQTTTSPQAASAGTRHINPQG